MNPRGYKIALSYCTGTRKGISWQRIANRNKVNYSKLWHGESFSIL